MARFFTQMQSRFLCFPASRCELVLRPTRSCLCSLGNTSRETFNSRRGSKNKHNNWTALPSISERLGLSQRDSVQIFLTPPLTSCLTQNRFLNLSKLQPSYLWVTGLLRHACEHIGSVSGILYVISKCSLLSIIILSSFLSTLTWFRI